MTSYKYAICNIPSYQGDFRVKEPAKDFPTKLVHCCNKSKRWKKVIK